MRPRRKSLLLQAARLTGWSLIAATLSLGSNSTEGGEPAPAEAGGASSEQAVKLAEGKLKASLPRMLTEAAAIDVDKIADLVKIMNGPPKEGTNIPLTALAFGDMRLNGLPQDLIFHCDPNASSKWIKEAGLPGRKKVSVIQERHIADLSVTVEKSCLAAKGVVQIKNEYYSASFPFEAKQVKGQWEVTAFDLPKCGWRLERTDSGTWRKTILNTSDLSVIFGRTVSRQFSSRSLPMSLTGLKPDENSLKTYKEIQAPGEAKVSLSKDAAGIIIAAPAEIGIQGLLQDMKPASGGGNLALISIAFQEKDVRIFPLPKVLFQPPSAPEGELSPIAVTITKDQDGKPSITANGYPVRDLNDLTGKLATLNVNMPGIPVVIMVARDVPIWFFVGVVDACYRGSVERKNIALDLSRIAKSDKKDAP